MSINTEVVLPVEIDEEHDEIIAESNHTVSHVTFQLTSIMNLSWIIDPNVSPRSFCIPVRGDGKIWHSI